MAITDHTDHIESKPPPKERHHQGEEKKFAPISLKNFFAHHDMHPLAADALLIKTFGADFFVWEPETIWHEIYTRFGTLISHHNRNKVQALRTIHNTDRPWKEWVVFEKVIMALTNNIPVFPIMQKPTLSQLFAGCDMIKTLRDEKYSDEVAKYVSAVAKDDGVIYCPPPIDFADYIFQEEVLESQVAQEYDKIVSGEDLDVDKFDETPVGVQLTRLVVALGYMLSMQQRAKEQLSLVKQSDMFKFASPSKEEILKKSPLLQLMVDKKETPVEREGRRRYRTNITDTDLTREEGPQMDRDTVLSWLEQESGPWTR